MQNQPNNTKIKVQNLTMGYDDFILQKDMNFHVNKGDVFIVMGGSGCGKSSLLKVLTGLNEPLKGSVYINGQNFTKENAETRKKIMQKCGILYQSGALFSSMTLAQNIALPLQQYTTYSNDTIDEIVSLNQYLQCGMSFSPCIVCRFCMILYIRFLRIIVIVS